MPSLGMAEILILCLFFAFTVAAVAGLVWVVVRLSGRNAGTPEPISSDSTAQAQRDLEARVARLENERQRPD